jgi:membrane protein
VATIGILVTQGSFFGYLTEWLDIQGRTLSWAGQSIRILITFLLVFISIALIYRYAPSVRKKWKLASPGSLLATFLIIGFTVLFSFWVNNIASYNKVYGSLGGILILMLLIYVNSLVLLIGFELNVSINSLKSIAQRRAQREADNALD